ncbi:MAG: extradiol dioxygenase family protein [Paraglaciecola sp.]|jgi:extradiol dioxygenase family protein
MSNCFHMAIPAGDLNVAKAFYCGVLGCATGNSEDGHWVDINFWGNELTLHQSEECLPTVRHDVDMGNVSVPHFGAHLSEDDFQNLKKRIAAAKLEYFDQPYRRFVGSEFEQETFFIKDPNGNVLEIKTMLNPSVLFKVTDSSLVKDLS